MSLCSTVKSDFWQSTAKGTIRERCKCIFNQDLLSDVKFVVRDSQGESENKKIPAHKFLLAISSPVFFAMFYSKLAETDSVQISDCDYESLLEMFRFIYSDEVNVNPDNVMQLMYLAKKYMLPSLVDKCSAYLQENLDTSNVFHVLSAAQKYDQKDLSVHCWKLIEKETEDAVKTAGFLAIERLLLEKLVENDSLNIEEKDLFKAVDSWAEKACEKQDLAAEGPVKRRILGERIVKAFRYVLMDEKEFVSIVLDCDILTKREICEQMKRFSSESDGKIPVVRSEARRAGYQNALSRFTTLSGCGEGWDYGAEYWPDRIGFKADKNTELHAVRLFGSEHGLYSVTLKVYDHEENKPVNCLATKTGHFLSKKIISGEIGDYQGFEIQLESPVSVKANTAYEIDANINGPPSMYGRGGIGCVELAGVTFSFGSFTMSQTSVEKGQFSELFFTVMEDQQPP